MYEVCCGMDVHKKTAVACLLVQRDRGETRKEGRTFKTTLGELLKLAGWLAEAGCSHVTMESTVVYWKPIYNVLSGQVEMLVANAPHLKAVPRRKTDVKDAEWIAQLLQHGLLRASYIPWRFLFPNTSF